MGYQMTSRAVRLAFAGLLAGVATPALAQQAPSADAAGPAAGVELFASTDSDDTSVVKLLGRGLVSDRGPDRYAGIALQHRQLPEQLIKFPDRFKPRSQMVCGVFRGRGYGVF